VDEFQFTVLDILNSAVLKSVTIIDRNIGSEKEPKEKTYDNKRLIVKDNHEYYDDNLVSYIKPSGEAKR